MGSKEYVREKNIPDKIEKETKSFHKSSIFFNGVKGYNISKTNNLIMGLRLKTNTKSIKI